MLKIGRVGKIRSSNPLASVSEYLADADNGDDVDGATTSKNYRTIAIVVVIDDVSPA